MKHLFCPQSVALVGASDRPGAFGCFAAKGLVESGDKIRYYLINHRKNELFGQKTYPALADLPECPQMVMIATPAPTVNDILTQAGEMGVKAAIVFSSGFAEDHRCGGVELEKQMAAIAERYGIKVVGPNCVGILNNVDKIKLWGSTGELDFARPKGVAVLAQSGGYAIGGVTRQHIDISYAISSGNGNIVTMEELAEYCVEDDDVTAVAMYCEGIKKAEVFYRMLRKAAEKKKPVIILKSGRSEKGAISAASHTGNLTGSNEVFEAIFEKYGVLAADTAEEFYGLLQVCSIAGKNLPKSNRFAIICRSGGETTMSADLAERYGVELPDICEDTRDKINAILPDFATAKNPMDMTADLLGDAERVGKLLDYLAADPNIDAIIAAFDFEASGQEVGYDMNAFMGQPLLDYQKKPGALPMFMIPQYEAMRDEKWRMKLKEAGIPLLGPGEMGYSVMGKIARRLAYHPEERCLEQQCPLPAALTGTPVSLSEHESKKALAEGGIPVDPGIIVRTEAELELACRQLGFPLVCKINSRDILHKTDAGGVKLGINSLDEAKRAFWDIQESCMSYAPSARLDGLLVQKMAPGGMEIIIGVKNDPQFGPMLLTGLGGVFVEIFGDAVLTPCPVGREEALRLLTELKAYKLLSGYRGAKPCDIGALADLMVKVSRYGVEHKDTLLEMDLNPVFVYDEGRGVCIVDALIVEAQ